MGGLGCMSCGGTCRDGLGAFFGLGDDSTDPGWDDTGSSDVPIVTLDTSGSPQWLPTLDTSSSGGSGGSIGGGSGGSSSNPALTNAETSIATAWTKIAGNVIAPQTTITTPQGLSISTPAGQTSNLSNLLGGASLLNSSQLSSLGSILPLALLAFAGFMLVSAMGNKH